MWLGLGFVHHRGVNPKIVPRDRFENTITYRLLVFRGMKGLAHVRPLHSKFPPKIDECMTDGAVSHAGRCEDEVSGYAVSWRAKVEVPSFVAKAVVLGHCPLASAPDRRVNSTAVTTLYV